jgi:signal transduction histidine kinase
VKKVVAAALHAREIVKKLLLFARQTPPRRIPVHLGAIAREALAFLEPRCARAGIEVVQEIDPDLPEIVADPSLLEQVVVNLVVNSIQAMPMGGRLTVRVRGRAGGVALEVEDTGVGMTDEVQRRIFTPFFTTKEVGQGTGLGLAVVHGIVAAHGGTIRFESRLGQGTRFVIDLPAAPP